MYMFISMLVPFARYFVTGDSEVIKLFTSEINASGLWRQGRKATAERYCFGLGNWLVNQLKVGPKCCVFRVELSIDLPLLKTS